MFKSGLRKSVVEKSKLELDRCILFPRVEEAVIAIESKEIDSRYEVEVIDLNYSLLSKLELFGFFSYPKKVDIKVTKNNLIKIQAEYLSLVIEVAINSRKQTTDKELIRVIDRFVEKSQRSKKQGLPIWLNT